MPIMPRRSLINQPKSRPAPYRAAATMFVESKTARLTVLIDPAKKEAFENLCAAQDLTPSQVVRQLIREYLNRNGVPWPKPETEPRKP